MLNAKGDLKRYCIISCEYKINKLDDFIEVFDSYLLSINYKYKDISFSSFHLYLLKLKYGRCKTNDNL